MSPGTVNIQKAFLQETKKVPRKGSASPDGLKYFKSYFRRFSKFPENEHLVFIPKYTLERVFLNTNKS